MDKLQLGWMVMKEKEQDQSDAAATDRTPDTAQRKRSHKDSIKHRLRKN